MVCGYGDQVGYETLVRQIARAQVDKSSRFTDWSRRPLSPAQMAYALADVTHLRRIYEVLAKRLEETGRAAWVEEELAVLTDPATYRHRPRRGLDPDQDPLDRAALRRRAARARPAARDAGAEPQRAARPHPQGRRAARARRQPAEDREDLAKSRLLLREARRGEIADGILAAIAAAEAMPAADVPPPPSSRRAGPAPRRSPTCCACC